MKKIITLLALAGALSVNGADFVIQPLLNPGVYSLCVSNGALGGVTNLDSKWMNWGNVTTNVLNAVWTNAAGTAVRNTQANITNYNTDKFNLLSTAKLWPAPGGDRWTPDTMGYTNVGWFQGGALGTGTNAVPQSGANGGFQPAEVVVEMYGGAGLDSTVTFTFVPVIIDNNGNIYEQRNVAHDWVVSFTGVASTAGTNLTFTTNAPMARFNGFNGLMLRTIVNDDATAAITAAWVKKVLLCGWRP